MFSTFKYSGLASKIGVMTGRMLTNNDYKELLEKRTVNDIATYLKYNTHYRTILEEVNENLIHRGQLEKMLRIDLLEDYVKLFRFIGGNVKAFLKFAFIRHEIEDLKMALRILNTENNTMYIQDSLSFLQKYDSIDIGKLAASKDIEDFIQNLKGTVYFNILSPFIANKENINLFTIDMTLDMYFFSLIWKQKEKLLKGQDKSIIDRSFGSEIDMLNILWIYRGKKFYNISREILYSYIIPYRYKLKKEQIISMVEAKSAEDTMEAIKATRYAKVFVDINDHYYERSFSELVFNMHKRLARNKRFSIGSLMAYLHLKEIEIRNIISLIECIRYNISREDIRKYIVFRADE